MKNKNTDISDTIAVLALILAILGLVIGAVGPVRGPLTALVLSAFLGGRAAWQIDDSCGATSSRAAESIPVLSLELGATQPMMLLPTEPRTVQGTTGCRVPHPTRGLPSHPRGSGRRPYRSPSPVTKRRSARQRALDQARSRGSAALWAPSVSDGGGGALSLRKLSAFVGSESRRSSCSNTRSCVAVSVLLMIRAPRSSVTLMSSTEPEITTRFGIAVDASIRRAIASALLRLASDSGRVSAATSAARSALSSNCSVRS